MTSPSQKISSHQAELLGDYVYVYYDKATNEPFYIGRGKAGRGFSHERGSHNNLVNDRISAGGYGIDILAFGLDKETAKKVEAAAIDLIGIDALLNKTRGAGALQYGRIDARTLLKRLEDQVLTEVRHNMAVVPIRHTYKRYGDDEAALYESTRGAWDFKPEKAEQIEYLAGVVEKRIVYVMSVAAWLPANSTQYFINTAPKAANRIEFIGKTAPQEVQDLYLGKRLSTTIQQSMYLGPFVGRTKLKDGIWLP